jgi:hypothetical protein
LLVGCSRREEVVVPPKISLVNASPIAVRVGQPVRLTCAVDGTGTGVVDYRWRVSSSNPPVADSLDGIAVDWTAAQPGAYVATCTAANRAGTDMKSVLFTVERGDRAEPAPANLPKSPIAVRVKCEPAHARVGELVACSAEVGGATATPSYSWVTSFGKFEGEGERVTLRGPAETARGGQVDVKVDLTVSAGGGAGTASAAVLLDTRACDKTTLEATGTVAFTRENSDAGAAPDNGEAPAAGPTACAAQLAACMKQSGKADECVKSLARCQGAAPGRVDPAGADCCPTACVEAYFARRREACAAELVEGFPGSACYPAAH